MVTGPISLFLSHRDRAAIAQSGSQSWIAFVPAMLHQARWRHAANWRWRCSQTGQMNMVRHQTITEHLQLIDLLPFAKVRQLGFVPFRCVIDYFRSECSGVTGIRNKNNLANFQLLRVAKFSSEESGVFSGPHQKSPASRSIRRCIIVFTSWPGTRSR